MRPVLQLSLTKTEHGDPTPDGLVTQHARAAIRSALTPYRLRRAGSERTGASQRVAPVSEANPARKKELSDRLCAQRCGHRCRFIPGTGFFVRRADR